MPTDIREPDPWEGVGRKKSRVPNQEGGAVTSNTENPSGDRGGRGVEAGPKVRENGDWDNKRTMTGGKSDEQKDRWARLRKIQQIQSLGKTSSGQGKKGRSFGEGEPRG